LVLAAIACKAGLAEQLVPLSELGTAKYRGETGGLYGNGLNEPPAAHRQLAKESIGGIRPVDSQGTASAGGKIVLLSIGMSNTRQEFSAFMRLANQDRRKRRELVLVDGAQGGADAAAWAGHLATQRRTPRGDPWANVKAKLKAANVTDAQVQAIWVKQAIAGPAQHGEFPSHVRALEDALQKIVVRAGERFPNLRIVFLSSRIYGGYATGRLNPEPYAYESAFAVRGLITRQIKGDAALNPDAEQGAVRAPVLVWGPYLWADGETPRKADGLVWPRTDFGEDGTHPSPQGRRKVAEQLLQFFTKNELGKEVFAR
jgi:hypothetical protein